MRMHQPINWQGYVLLKRYRLLQLLGHGRIGEVWLAEDVQTQHQVAIKLLPTILAADKPYRQTFANEARLAVMLNHPHILPIYQFGEEAMEGNRIAPFLITPYVAGGTLWERIQHARGLLPVKESLSYLKQAALALDYAHSRQILHRDVKPSNMLLHQQTLLLTDFGIAKMFSGTLQYSQTYAAIGTAEYMAPEQASGQPEPASDLYSLAMIAYQLFTGSLPFKGETPYEILEQQISRPLPPPAQVNPVIPQMVADALTRGLAKKPEERFPSGTAFVEALENGWHTYITSSADPEATIVGPWSKRHPYNQPTMYPPQATEPSIPVYRPDTMSSAATEIVRADSAPSTPLSMSTQSTAVLPKSDAINNAPAPPFKPMQPASPPARFGFSVSRRAIVIGGAIAAIAAAGAVTAGVILPLTQRSTAPSRPKPAGPGPQQFIAGIPQLSLTGHTDKVWTACWDPTGRYLVSAGDDTRVMLWDIQSALQKKTGHLQSKVTPLNKWKFGNGFLNNSLSWSPDGRTLVVAPSTDNSIHLLKPFQKGAHWQEYSYRSKSSDLLPPSYENVAWAPGSSNMFASTVNFQNNLLLWQKDKVSGPIGSFHYEPPNLIPPGFNCLAWSLDGKYIAGLTSVATVVVWEAASREKLQELTLPSRASSAIMVLRNALQWSPFDAHKLLVSAGDIATVWNAVDNKLLLSLGIDDADALTPPNPNPSGWTPHTNGLCWSPNGRYIAGSYGRSNKVYIWDLQNTTSPHTNKNGANMQSMAFGTESGHTDTIIDIAWSPDGRYLATTSFDKTVMVWKVDG